MILNNINELRFTEVNSKYFAPMPVETLLRPIFPKDIPVTINERVDEYVTHVISNLYRRAEVALLEPTCKNKILVIGISGYAGSGKDAAINALEDMVGVKVREQWLPDVELACVHRMPFAGPLKAIAKIFGFSDEQLTDRTLKEKPDAWWGISPRQFLQMCGTEMFRKVWREDAWTQCFKREYFRIKDGLANNRFDHGLLHIVIVPDVRFHNEVACIKELGGVVVGVERPDNPNAIAHTHASEKDVPNLDVDITLVNDEKSANEWSLSFWGNLTQYLEDQP